MPPKKRGGPAASAPVRTESSTSGSASSATSSAASSVPTKVTCCVCCQTINTGKDDALFCSGVCQQWLHRYCAGVSVQCYKTIKDENHPFFCFGCYQSRSQRQIAALTSTVEELKLENSKLKESLNVAQLQVCAPVATGGQTRSYASVTGSATYNDSTESGSNMPKGQKTTKHDHPDRKYNVVVYGIEECPKGSPKNTRLQSDLNHVVSLLSKVDTTINAQSIKDCYRLGKFNPNQNHPRPILVKFIRISDVTSILYKKGDFSHPFSIKPDLTPEERHRDSLLLKERWHLIQSGKDRSENKSRGNWLYVNKKLFCSFVDTNLQYTSVVPSPHCHSQSVTPSDSTNSLPVTNDTSSTMPSNSTPSVGLPELSSIDSLTSTNVSLSPSCTTSNSNNPQQPPHDPSTPLTQPSNPTSD